MKKTFYQNCFYVLRDTVETAKDDKKKKETKKMGGKKEGIDSKPNSKKRENSTVSIEGTGTTPVENNIDMQNKRRKTTINVQVSEIIDNSMKKFKEEKQKETYTYDDIEEIMKSMHEPLTDFIIDLTQDSEEADEESEIDEEDGDEDDNEDDDEDDDEEAELEDEEVLEDAEAELED